MENKKKEKGNLRIGPIDISKDKLEKLNKVVW